jgi:hypothetical protein
MRVLPDCVVSDTAAAQSVIQNVGATALVNGRWVILNVLWERKPGQAG